jgi:hypothetical protein
MIASRPDAARQRHGGHAYDGRHEGGSAEIDAGCIPILDVELRLQHRIGSRLHLRAQVRVDLILVPVPGFHVLRPSK